MADSSPEPLPVRTEQHIPTLDPGVTLLETTEPRSTATHQLALQTIDHRSGPSYWIDARNTASTYALRELARSERLLDPLRIARAFTAYQHVTLVERVINCVTPRTGTIVAPNIASLYRDDDVPSYEAAAFLEIVVDALAAVAEGYEIPVLLTDAGPADRLGSIVREAASREITCERTGMGYRFEGEDVETTVYWQQDSWQTTIPYWVELLGAVSEHSKPRVGPTMHPDLELEASI